MSRKRPARLGKPDRRPQKQMPGPALAVIEERLYALLTPESFKPLKEAGGEKKLRERLLNLPVMMAIVLSLVYRRLPSLSEAVRLLEVEGLLWSQRLKVSKQAVSKRLSRLPPELFHQILTSMMAAIALIEQIKTDSQSMGFKLREVYSLVDSRRFDAGEPQKKTERGRSWRRKTRWKNDDGGGSISSHSSSGRIQPRQSS